MILHQVNSKGRISTCKIPHTPFGRHSEVYDATLLQHNTLHCRWD